MQPNDASIRQPRIPKPTNEPRPLGLRRDDTKIGEISSGQHFPADIEIDCMRKSHNHVPGAGGRVPRGMSRIVSDKAAYARRNIFRKSFGINVHPENVEW